MDVIDSAKQIVSKYYPRNHLILAGLLGLLLSVALMIPQSKTDTPNLTVIQLPLKLAAEESERLNNSAGKGLNTGYGLNNSAGESRSSTANTIDLSVNDTQAGFIGPATQFTKSKASANEVAQYSPWKELEVKPGDNLSDLFQRVGLSAQDLYKVVNSSSDAKVLNRLYPGYRLNFNIPESGELQQLEVVKSPLSGYLFTLTESGYKAEEYQLTPDIQTTFKQGTITGSLILDGKRADIPYATIYQMANIFGGVIDFNLDPRTGDDFSILYEQKYLDGEFIGTGEVVAAQFTNQGKQYIALRYEDENGDIEYYNPEGISMRKAFLRSPLEVFRITSNFSLARKHPILNTIRAHKGTDYAAPRGTPVLATSDGKVTWSARNGSFGKLVIIQHNGEFQTKYAHLNAYGKGIKKGVRVKQGQIIGYVGTTGGATGPHLHYEFLVNGSHKNPRTILNKLPKAKSIESGEIQRFLNKTQDLLIRFKKFNEPRLITAAD